jgi:hypothetical protein
MPVLACVFLLAVTLLSAPPAAAQHDDVQSYIERTGELLELASDVVGESSNQQARRVMIDANDLHARSVLMLDQGNWRAALSFSQRARKSGQHAVRIARESQSQENRVRTRLERYREFRDQILDRAREANDELALRFVRESEKQALRATDQYRQGNHSMAEQLIKPAEALLARAARLLFEGAGTGRLDQEIERTHEFIERTATRLNEQGADDEAAQDLLRSAREALERGRGLRDRGQPVRALQSLRLARRLASQAAMSAGGELGSETVQQQLDRWDERYELVAEEVREAGSRPAEQALGRARHHRENAGRLLDGDQPEQALRQIKAAFDLLNEASELAR